MVGMIDGRRDRGPVGWTRSRERLECHLAHCVGLPSTEENGEQLAGGSPKIGLDLVAHDMT